MFPPKSDMMKITDFCEKYDMLPRGSTVLAAVSGGKDSMCLLGLLLELAPERHLNIICAHFDHQLRGAASAADRRFVESWCQKIGVRCVSGSEDVATFAREKGLGTEEAARILRYEFLEKTADDLLAQKIATAHTANDNAETFLFNFARGSGLSGLCGVPPVRGRIIRPMLCLTSAQVLEYLDSHGIPHIEDETNAEDFCARNRIRHGAIPVLQGVCDGFDENAARCISILREDEEFLSGLASKLLDENYKDGRIPAAALASAPRPVAARAVRLIAGKTGLAAGHVDAVLSLATSADVHAAADIPGLRVCREYGDLRFGAPPALGILPRTVYPGDSFDLPEAGLHIECVRFPAGSEIYNSFNIFCFKSDSICDIITVRSRDEGDEIRLAGRGCTKSLKKLFSEARLNGAEKNLVPVFCDSVGIIAVGGFGIAERCLPNPGDELVVIKTDKKQFGRAL